MILLIVSLCSRTVMRSKSRFPLLVFPLTFAQGDTDSMVDCWSWEDGSVGTYMSMNYGFCLSISWIP